MVYLFSHSFNHSLSSFNVIHFPKVAVYGGAQTEMLGGETSWWRNAHSSDLK